MYGLTPGDLARLDQIMTEHRDEIAELWEQIRRLTAEQGPPK